MTPQEAKMVLKRECLGDSELMELAKYMGAEALEKQIPQKQRTDNHDWRCCPRCYKTFSMVNVLNERNRYCGNCGQALDWSG